jgi:hypothetical protein
MHDDHYAIVIGIDSYPRLGEPPPSNLEGPENDAEAVAAWLTDPNGGGLAASNVRKIVSRDCQSPPNAAPTPDQINEAFLWLDGIAEINKQAGKGRRVGSRFYFYLSGHGCAPKPREGVLLTGNAANNMMTANIFPMEWIDWLQDANYFHECVLWMDCCTERQVFTVPGAAPLKPVFASDAPGPEFIALAAPYGLKAVEKPIPEDAGKWHGIFTWSLLEGLRGAAADQNGTITSQSLSDWLRQAQLGWLTDDERANPDVAKQPEIIKSDPLVFATGVAPLDFDVTLRVNGAAAPVETRIWCGSPPAPSLQVTIARAGSGIKLKPGLYLAEADNGLRHGFAVTKSTSIDLVDRGDRPVNQGGALFGLTIDPGDSAADVSVFDHKFAFLDDSTGRRSGPRLPFGLYQYRIGVGRKKVEKVILLDRDWPPRGGPPPANLPAATALPQIPLIVSAAPLAGTRVVPSNHARAALDAQHRIDRRVGEGAELLVMSRVVTADGAVPAGAAGWRRVTILDHARNIVANLAEDGQADTNSNPVASCALSLSPGVYELRFAIKSGVDAAQSLIVPPGGWRVEVYLLWYGVDSVQPATALLMRRTGTAFGTNEDLVLQKALVVLADERPIAEGEFLDSLLEGIDNPLAAIVGAHLLLLTNESKGAPAPERLNEVVKRLRGLGGNDHPDVEAISLLCPDAGLHTARPVSAPPMLERSWRLLIRVSLDAQGAAPPALSSSELVPLALWKQVMTSMPALPFLRWATDPTIQNALLAAQMAKVQSLVLSETSAQAEKSAAIAHNWASAIAEPLRAWIGLPNKLAPPNIGAAVEQVLQIQRHLHAQATRMGLPAAALASLTQLYAESNANAHGSDRVDK